LVYWALMDGLLHLVQQAADWAEAQPAQAGCTKCNSPPINAQCTDHPIAVMVRCSAVFIKLLTASGIKTTLYITDQ